jgi:hypothetical protein
MLSAVGAFGCGALGHDAYQQGYTDESENCQQDTSYGNIFFLFGVILHAAVQARADGAYTCHHAGVPIPVFQVRNHIPGLDALADSVGQVSFQTIACIELNAALVGHQ